MCAFFSMAKMQVRNMGEQTSKPEVRCRESNKGRPSLVVLAFNPSPLEAEVGGFEIRGQPGLQRELQDSQGYTQKSCLKKKYSFMGEGSSVIIWDPQVWQQVDTILLCLFTTPLPHLFFYIDRKLGDC